MSRLFARCFFTAGTLALLGSVSVAAPQIRVTNPTLDDWAEIPVEVPIGNGMKDTRSVKDENGCRVPVQLNDLDGDGTPDQLVFVAHLFAGQTRTFTPDSEPAPCNPPSRAHTGMYVKTPTSKGFEGPGWESDRIGFRFYWDSRDASDIFGKTHAGLSLAELAKPGLDYHRLSKWGQDVLHVGPAVGIGGFGAFINGKIEKVAQTDREFKVRADGPIEAVADLIFTNWKAAGRTLDLTVRMKMFAGQNDCLADMFAKAEDGKPLPELICGFVKQTTQTELIKDPSVAMVGRWGNQALAPGEVPLGGNLGMAVMAAPESCAGIEEDTYNDFIRLKPSKDGKVSYRYLANWFKEPVAAKSAKEFEQMMRATARRTPKVEVTGQ